MYFAFLTYQYLVEIPPSSQVVLQFALFNGCVNKVVWVYHNLFGQATADVHSFFFPHIIIFIDSLL